MPRGSYLGAMTAFFGVCFAVVAFVVVVDPYHLYPWGRTPELSRESYSAEAVPLIMKAVTKGDYDTFYIGASTSAGFSAWDMRDILPGTTKAFNLSLLGASIRDIEVMMDLVAKAPKLRRALVQLELSFTAKPDAVDPRFVHIPTAISSSDPTESLRAVDERALQLAWKLIRHEDYFVEGWGERNPTQFLDWARAHYQTPAYAAHLVDVVDNNRGRLDQAGESSCARFPALSILDDFAAALAARGAELDIVFPPYSRAMWFEWVAPGSDFQWNKGGTESNGTPLSFVLLMRRCVATQMRKYPGAKIFAFDWSDDIVGDYANYADPAHPGNRNTYLSMLRAVAADDHRVTADTFPAYEAALREKVMHYKFFDSASR